MDIKVTADDAQQRVFIQLGSLGDSLTDRRALSKPLLAGVQIIQREAKQLAPRDSGFLRSQIIAWTNWRKTDAPLTGFVTVATRAKRMRNGKLKAQRLADKASKGRSSAVVTAFYGRFLEEGTEKMAAEPFMSPSVERVGEQATETVMAGARSVLLQLMEAKL